MTKNAFILVFFKFYNMLWTLALPFLKKNKRLSLGFRKRVSWRHHKKADIWIQAASAGEAYLAVNIIKNLTPQRRVNILVTSITSQGLDILRSGLTKEPLHKLIRLEIDWFPFDLPQVIEKTVKKINPGVTVLLETEIWPALFCCLKQNQSKIFIINARLSKKSYALYLKSKFLWQHLSPDRILATSGLDAGRYRHIFEQARVDTMPNIKFESIGTGSTQGDAIEKIKRLLPKSLPLSILASVREKESNEVIHIVKALLKSFPNQVVAIFPRHIHRMGSWEKRLTSQNLNYYLRSQIKSPLDSPGIILWDTFGELKTAYGAASVVFVGGSLKPMGGQNFIEPALAGAVTITGPYYDDFAWAGDDIFDKGIVIKKNHWESVARAMCLALEIPGSRSNLKHQAKIYVNAHQGGTRQACDEILKAFDETR